MNIVVVYDDTVPKSEIIMDIIGEKGFSDVVVKRCTLKDRIYNILTKEYPNVQFILLKSKYEFNQLSTELEKKYEHDSKVLHIFSTIIVSDEEAFLLTMKKISFIDESYVLLCENTVVGMMYPNIKSYSEFIRMISRDSSVSSIKAARMIQDTILIDGIVNIGKIENFIQCITGNFDARYFNTLKGDEYTIVKSSSNKKKIKAEYTFFHLLPEDMQMWFVEPFGYHETDDKASYTMERLHMTDLAIKWVHGSVDEEELETILDKYFYFFNHRHKRKVTKEQYQNIADMLYIKKVRERIDELKKLPQFETISKLLSLNNEQTIDKIYDKYLQLKKRIEETVSQDHINVIGHGDPCFANTMYNKSTKTLKFIDPKGALTEEELWTNPYYDIAKLSHSICGRYDFFNNALFEIIVNSNFHTELHIDFDNHKYISVFKNKVEKNGYNYLLVRIYEASLFLSMLPLHIDNPHKVYGFILNACNILKEIEEYV